MRTTTAVNVNTNPRERDGVEITHHPHGAAVVLAYKGQTRELKLRYAMRDFDAEQWIRDQAEAFQRDIDRATEYPKTQAALRRRFRTRQRNMRARK